MLLFVTLLNWNLLDSFNRHFDIWFQDEGCCSTYDVEYWHRLLLSNFELANFLHSVYLKNLVHLIYLQLIKALVCLFHFMRSLYRICMPWPQVMFSVCCYFALFLFEATLHLLSQSPTSYFLYMVVVTKCGEFGLWTSLTSDVPTLRVHCKCNTLDQMMKENGAKTSRIINGNWVAKGKRRKLPGGADSSNGKEGSSIASDPTSTSSSKRRLKNELSSARSSSKKKGNDGVH